MDFQTWQHCGRKISLMGHQLFVAQAGPEQAPALLLIHGFPSSSWDWIKLWPELTARYRVVALDMLGFGLSDKPRGHQYRLMQQADLQEALLAALGIERCHVLAHDYGDSVAQELLARQLDGRATVQFLSMCFLNGGLFPETHRTLLIQKLLLSRFGWCVNRLTGFSQFKRSFSRVFAPASQPSQSDLATFWQMICWQGGHYQLYRLIRYIEDRRTHRTRWLEALQQADIPLALINGSFDPISGAHVVRRYKELGCRLDYLVELPDVGHYPQFEAPSEVLAAWLAFQAQI